MSNEEMGFGSLELEITIKNMGANRLGVGSLTIR